MLSTRKYNCHLLTGIIKKIHVVVSMKPINRVWFVIRYTCNIMVIYLIEKNIIHFIRIPNTVLKKENTINSEHTKKKYKCT